MFRKVDLEEFLLVHSGLTPLLEQKSAPPSGGNNYWGVFGSAVADQCVLKVVHGVKDEYYFINDLEVEKLVDQGILNLEWVDSDEVSS